MKLWMVDGIIWIISYIVLASDERLSKKLGDTLANTITSIAAILLLASSFAFPFVVPEPLRTGFKVIALVLFGLLVLVIIVNIIKYIFGQRKE